MAWRVRWTAGGVEFRLGLRQEKVENLLIRLVATVNLSVSSQVMGAGVLRQTVPAVRVWEVAGRVSAPEWVGQTL